MKKTIVTVVVGIVAMVIIAGVALGASKVLGTDPIPALVVVAAILYVARVVGTKILNYFGWE